MGLWTITRNKTTRRQNIKQATPALSNFKGIFAVKNTSQYYKQAIFELVYTQKTILNH